MNAGLRTAIIAWSGMVALLAMTSAALCGSGVCRVPGWDRRVLEALADWRDPTADAFFSAITWAGSVAVLLPFAMLAAFACLRRGHFREAVFIPASLLGASALAHAAKAVIERARPDIALPPIPMPADLSFPSAHSMQIVAFVLALGIVRARSAPHATGPFAVAGATVVVLVAFSRLHLQVHFPSDVVTGIAVSALWVTGLAAFFFGSRERVAAAPA